MSRIAASLLIFLGQVYTIVGSSQVALVVKNLPAKAGDVRDTVWSLAQEDALKEGMATHSSILARRIPWTAEPGGLQSIGLRGVQHDWSNLACTHTHTPQLTGFRILERQCSIHTVYFVTFTEELDQSHIIKYLNISSVKCRNGWVLLPNISWRNFQVSEHFLFQSHGLVRYPIL